MLTQTHEQKVISAYLEGKPIEKIYSDIGVGHETLYKLLMKYSVPTREVHKASIPTINNTNSLVRGVRVVYSPDRMDIGDKFRGGYISRRSMLRTMYEYTIQPNPIIQ